MECERPIRLCQCGKSTKCYGDKCEDCWVSTSAACQTRFRPALTRDGAPPYYSCAAKRRDGAGGMEGLVLAHSAKNDAPMTDLSDLVTAILRAPAINPMQGPLLKPKIAYGKSQPSYAQRMARRNVTRKLFGFKRSNFDGTTDGVNGVAEAGPETDQILPGQGRIEGTGGAD